MGIGDWGLGIGPNPQSPIPNIFKLNNYKTFNFIIDKGFTLILYFYIILICFYIIINLPK